MLLLKSLKDVDTILETNSEIIWSQADHQICSLASFYAQGFFKKKKLLEISSGNQYLFFSRHDIPQYYVHGHGERNKTC
jgi:hypothetical protein